MTKQPTPHPFRALRLLSGAPLIARVTHLYEIVSVEEEK